MKPDNVRAAGVLFLVGGCTSLLICSVLTLVTIFIWFPAYMYGIPTALYALATGIKLLGKKAEGSGFHTGAGGMLIFQTINLDFIGAICGYIAMVKLSMPQARRYLRKQMNFPPPSDPQKGRVQLDIGYNPGLLFFIVATPGVRVDGHRARRGWGHQSVEVEQGRHTIEVSFDYLFFQRLGLTSIEIEVVGGLVNDLFYRFNAPWIFAQGVLEELKTLPSSAAPPTDGGQPPAGNANQPVDGMQPFSV